MIKNLRLMEKVNQVSKWIYEDRYFQKDTIKKMINDETILKEQVNLLKLYSDYAIVKKLPQDASWIIEPLKSEGIISRLYREASKIIDIEKDSENFNEEYSISELEQTIIALLNLNSSDTELLENVIAIISKMVSIYNVLCINRSKWKAVKKLYEELYSRYDFTSYVKFATSLSYITYKRSKIWWILDDFDKGLKSKIYLDGLEFTDEVT